MKISSKILALSKNNEGKLFKPSDLRELKEICDYNNLKIDFDSPLLFFNGGIYELYWLPSKFVKDDKTGSYDLEGRESFEKMYVGYLNTNWEEELKHIGAYEEVTSGKVKTKELMENLWIEIELM